MIPACDLHRPLVEAVNDGEPTDDQLEAYAEQVPECPDCRQRLAVAARVHPSVLAQGGTTAVEDLVDDPGMARLGEVLETRSSPRRRALAAGILLATAAAAALTLWAIQPASEAPVRGAPEPAPEVAEAVPPAAPEGPPEVARPPRAAPSDDAVADAQPEALPDFEDVRGGTPKSAAGTLSLALVLANTTPAVGEVVPLTITASQATPATLCVRGPEDGVVWRGHLPEGRTPLARDGQPIGFAFEHTGDYRFELATADDPSCADPVQRVTVTVSP